MPLIWLLNLASFYRDARAHGIYDDDKLCSVSDEQYWLWGSQGPFGLALKSSDTKGYAALATNNEELEFGCLQTLPCLRPWQQDGSSCGVVWCMFMYDVLSCLWENDMKMPSETKKIYKPASDNRPENEVGLEGLLTLHEI